MRGKTKPKTFRNDTASVHIHLLPFFGADRIETIDDLRVEEYVSACKVREDSDGNTAPLSASTINFTLRMLRKILINARKRRVISDLRVIPFEKEAVLRNEFSEDEQTAYLAAFDDEAGFRAYLAQKRVYG